MTIMWIASTTICGGQLNDYTDRNIAINKSGFMNNLPGNNSG